MNIYQRVVLICGAVILFLVMLIQFGTVSDYYGGHIPVVLYPQIAFVVLVKGSIVIAMTVIIFYALKGIVVKKSQIIDQVEKCPYCAELIKKEAIVCRYCGKDLPETPPSNPDSPSYCPSCKSADAYYDATNKMFCPNCKDYVQR